MYILSIVSNWGTKKEWNVNLLDNQLAKFIIWQIV